MFKKIVIGCVVLIIVLVILAGLFMDTLVKNGIENIGSDIVGTQVKVGRVDAALLAGRLSLFDLSVANPKGFSGQYAVRVKQISVDLSLASLLSDVIRVKRIYIGSPELHYDVGLNGSNIDKLSGHANSSANQSNVPGKPATDKGASSRVVIDQLLIEHAEVTGSIAVLKTGMKLKRIVLTGIGKQPGGATIAQVVSQVLAAMIGSLSNAGVETFGNTIKGVFDQLTGH